MTKFEIDDYIKKSREIVKIYASSKRKARKLLREWGFIDKKGNLNKDYCYK